MTTKTTRIPKIVSQAEWLAATSSCSRRRKRRRGRGQARRGATQAADGEDRQGVRVRGAGRQGEPARSVRGSPPAHPLSLHVRARGRWLADGRLPGLLDGRRPDHPLAHLHARDTSFAMISLAPLPNIQALQEAHGVDLPGTRPAASDFNDDFGVSTPKGETFGLSVFFRDGEKSIAPISPPDAASRRSAPSLRCST